MDRFGFATNVGWRPFSALGRAVNLLPRRREPIEKGGEVIAGARRRLAVAIRDGRQIALQIPDLLEQYDRIECDELSAQLFFDSLVNQRRGQQALTGCERRMIAPAYPRTVALLAGEFEGGWKKKDR